MTILLINIGHCLKNGKHPRLPTTLKEQKTQQAINFDALSHQLILKAVLISLKGSGFAFFSNCAHEETLLIFLYRNVSDSHRLRPQCGH
jgi:hypothetical protein